jgi:hypothetical protein
MRFGALLALAMGVALSGCSGSDFGSDAGWFRKPLDFSGKNAGYSYSDLQEARQTKAIGGGDLVDGSGACPAASPAAPAAPPSTLGEGVGLGMSECDVVARAGAPANVQIGTAPNGQRSAVLTYNGGPRPGIYHFEGGHLTQMDRVDVPLPAPQVAKKKPAKPKKQAASNN